MSVSNPYEQHIYNTMERIILAEDVKFSEVKDIEGKFYVKVMTPTVDTTDLSTKNVKGYSSKNYITLKIPAYLLWSFMFPKVSKVSLGKGDGSQILMTFNTTNFIIPKGTKFLMEILGGEIEYDRFNIIGLELSGTTQEG